MYLFFDLDGTLTDSRDGVVRCIQHALVELGVPAPPAEQLTWCVGPPLAGSFERLLGTSDSARIEAAIAAYRERFERVGMFENAIYPGIPEALAQFAEEHHLLYVVTSKPRIYARQILEHFGLAQAFRAIHGPEMGLRHYSKGVMIRNTCASERIAANSAVMIGDRIDDIAGAKENGLRSIGVSWGYGSQAELEAAAPDYLVASADELVATVRGIV
jgi:phosphoglycolate phosphatase